MDHNQYTELKSAFETALHHPHLKGNPSDIGKALTH